MPYKEQEGSNLQAGPNKGEIVYWYIFINPINIELKMVVIIFKSVL